MRKKLLNSILNKYNMFFKVRFVERRGYLTLVLEVDT